MYTVSYFEIVFSVLTGFSVNFTLGKKAVGIYEDTHRSYKSLNANLRLVLLTRAFKQNSDP